MPSGGVTALRSWIQRARRQSAERMALLRVLPRVSTRLTVAAAAATIVGSLLPPAFTLASGALVGSIPGAVRDGVWSPAGHRVLASLAAATVIYVLIHVFGPIRETIGDVLMRRLDEHLTLRVMRAVTAPRGVAHLEDPAVLDRIAQAQGAVTGATPGAAAYYQLQVWAQRLQGGASLALVARFDLGIAALLLAGHVVSFKWRRWHWSEVTSVMFGFTDVLRRSHYMRSLAVERLAAKEARVFSLGDWMVDRYRDTFLDSMRPIWRERRNGGVVAVVVTTLLFAVEGAALWRVVDAGLAGAIGLGAVVVYSQAIVAASNLGQFHEGQVFVEEGSAALRVLAELEEIVPSAGADLTGGQDAEDMPRREIRLESVSFRYPTRDEPVFKSLDLTIEAGKSLAIVGENGAGKTTLVKLLARLYDPTAGRITIDGVDLRELDPVSWQRRVAAIFQDYVQFQLSAYDNVAFGALDRAADRAAVEEAAALAGAASLVEGLPGGWETVLSRGFTGGTELSGGEWQRIALARAIFAITGGAGVLILDEPTAALDVRGEAEIYDRFLELTQGVTTIVISHRFSTVRRADRIVVLEHGQVVEDGTHDELVAHGGRYAEMYELQASRFRDGEVAS